MSRRVVSRHFVLRRDGLARVIGMRRTDRIRPNEIQVQQRRSEYKRGEPIGGHGEESSESIPQRK